MPFQTTRTVMVAINGDDKFELDESFFIDLSNPVNADLADGQGMGTITNDDPLPSITINESTMEFEGTSSDSDTLFGFSITLSNPSSELVSMFVETVDGSATAEDGDYQAVFGGISIEPGMRFARLLVQVSADRKFEPTETFAVKLSFPENATIVQGQSIGTIINDDSEPTISIDDVTGFEGNGNDNFFFFTISLSNPSFQTITVAVATADGSATVADDDYVPNSDILTFQPGEESPLFPFFVVVRGDFTPEPDETFFVNLTNPTNATIARGTGVGTILNDDGPVLAAGTTVQWHRGNGYKKSSSSAYGAENGIPKPAETMAGSGAVTFIGSEEANGRDRAGAVQWHSRKDKPHGHGSQPISRAELAGFFAEGHVPTDTPSYGASLDHATVGQLARTWKDANISALDCFFAFDPAALAGLGAGGG